MKKLLIVLLFVVAGTFLCGNALALETYVSHITGGETGWTDYLQVNNNTSSSANFTLTLYNGGNQIYSNVFSVGGLSRSQIQLKALHPGAETGAITYTESGLVFRVSYNNSGGGIAEFMTIDTLGSMVGLYFSDFTSFVQWKGAAIANMGSTPADVTLYAIGGGSILGTHTATINPKDKIIGIHSAWFSSLNLSQVESIVAVTGSSSLCGVAIGGDMAQTRLLFTPATPVSNFNPPTEYVAQYAGSYSGTYSGVDFGTWSVTANSTGNISGTYHSNTSGLTQSVSGTVFSNGTVIMAAGGTSEGATFSGTIDSSGNWSGTWTNSLYVTSGTFIGGRTVYTQADLTGTWNIQILTAGSSSRWMRFTAMIDSSGFLTLSSFLDSAGNTGLPPVNSIQWTIDSNGVISERGVNAADQVHMTMTSNKNFIAGTGSDNLGRQLRVIQKMVPGTVYSNADVRNMSFVSHELTVGSHYQWSYGARSTAVPLLGLVVPDRGRHCLFWCR